MKLFRVSFISLLIWSMTLNAFQPQSPKTAAEIEAEEMEALAEQFLKELPEIEKKLKEQAEAKKRAEEEQIALKKIRAELDARLEAEEKRKAQEENIEQRNQRFAQIFAHSYENYSAGNPIIIEYFSTQTLQNLLDYVKTIGTEVTAPLAQKFNKHTQEIYEFGVGPFSDVIKNELNTRRNLPGTDFKSLIIKGLNKPPYHVNFETFDILQNKLKSIELLQQDEAEKRRWAHERDVAPDQIGQALINIKEPLLKMAVNVKKRVLEDLEAIEKEKREEQQARDHIIKVIQETKQLQTYQLKVDTVKKEYPMFFFGIPYDLEVNFLKKFEELYGKEKQINYVLTNLYFDERQKPIALKNRLTALGTILGFKPYASYGFVFFDNKGQRSTLSDMSLPKLLSITDPVPSELRKKVTEGARKLVETYKIHLMPDENMDVAEILVQLKKALDSDPELSSLVQTFKIHINPTKQGNTIFPRVVIYAHGKEHAQKILNSLYKNRFIQQMKGSGLRPRYNGKVNDLTWVAQGDGDYKEDLYSPYYELPHKIYYHPRITGKQENYHLIHPGTKQEIVN